MEKTILHLFPEKLRPLWREVAEQQRSLQEIRMRAGQPILIHKGGMEFFLEENGKLATTAAYAHIMAESELGMVLEHICQYSPYAYEEELRRGFITVAGGHRIGLVGQAVLNQDGSLRTLKHISAMNIRISHQIKGVADGILPRVYSGGEVKNILIISPPGCGKTTLLRDLIRQISDGNAFGAGRTVAVVDERSELAGSYLGKPQNDMGMRTDVLDGCPKAVGMQLLLRSMSPRVIAIDELGGEEDFAALGRASVCGCRILATVHGEDLEDVQRRFGRKREEWMRMFDMFLILDRINGKFGSIKVVEGEKNGC